MKTPKISAAIVCDDVRLEVNGKQIIIGVYNSDIRLDSYPSTIMLTLWLQVENFHEEDATIKFRCRLDTEQLVGGQIEITLRSGAGRGSIPIGPFPVGLTRNGLLKFEVNFSRQGKWQLAVQLPVIAINPSPTASPPPA